MLRYEDARQMVITQAELIKQSPSTISLNVSDALGYVLAEEIHADREYPPFDRSTRDGYAVRAAETGPNKTLRCVGEIKAGDTVTQALPTKSCVQIMTGAAVPNGADAVVMVELTTRDGEIVTVQRETSVGQNIVPRGTEATAGSLALSPGLRLGFAELAIAAQVGASRVLCFKKPRVAILSTGDEVVPITETPGPFHIRNSNSVSLGAQVRLAGGEPVLRGNATDRAEDLAAKIELGLHEDMLVLSGGVSMGKYDLVESVLKSMGAEFFFDAVGIRPGKPTVFGRIRNKLVFGLPGNPVSTMVTFLLFATPAIDCLSGARARPLPLLQATLAEAMHEKPGLAHFLPARLDWTHGRPMVAALKWHGSGDIAALSRANCFVVVPSGVQDIAMGESVSVLLRGDVV